VPGAPAVRGGPEMAKERAPSSKVPPAFRVREAVPSDRVGMARVHVETWRSTYRGIVPDAHLDALTVQSDLDRGFGRWLTDPPPGWTHRVAVLPEGEVIGFAVGGTSREEDPAYRGELGAIYVLREHQRHGVGTALLREIVGHVLSLGHRSMFVWVLEGNPYQAFYAKLGGVVVRRRTAPVAGTTLPELAYGWSDLSVLAARISG
jgi:GNAT superfamily N-acetyltransferase